MKYIAAIVAAVALVGCNEQATNHNVTGWWSTEIDPSGQMYDCFTAIRETTSGVGVWCTER